MEQGGMEQGGMEQGMQPGMEQGMQQPEVGVGPEEDQEQYNSEEMMDDDGLGDPTQDDDLDNPAMGPEDAAAEADAEMEGGEEGMGEEDPTEVDKEDLLGNLSKLDALIQDLTAEISGGAEEMEGEEGEEEFEEEGGEEEFEEEGEEEGVDLDGDGENDVDVEKEEPPKRDSKVKKKSKPPFK